MRVDREYLRQKIRSLEDEKIVQLLGLKKANGTEIFLLVQEEAANRNIHVKNDPVKTNEQTPDGSDLTLPVWNWGAFFFSPCWLIANGFMWWTVLLTIPFLNIAVVVFFAARGNALAFSRQKVLNRRDYIEYQRNWSRTGVQMFLWFIVIALLIVILEVILS